MVLPISRVTFFLSSDVDPDSQHFMNTDPDPQNLMNTDTDPDPGQ